MANDRRVRIYASGETKSLESLQTMYSYKPDVPGAAERAKRENRKRNMRLSKELEARGLYPSGNINAYLGRAHSLGWRRQQVEMIGWACMVNALTLARHRSADGLLQAA